MRFSAPWICHVICERRVLLFYLSIVYVALHKMGTPALQIQRYKWIHGCESQTLAIEWLQADKGKDKGASLQGIPSVLLILLTHFILRYDQLPLDVNSCIYPGITPGGNAPCEPHMHSDYLVNAGIFC
ncbi:hypothetical protein K474DRAFT_887062 [Panus rudis PR-1116 ss-1]|nr:hypothetical protein K474DRAFT_887062 [Panus rudis PR-1116 ss-1]